MLADRFRQNDGYLYVLPPTWSVWRALLSLATYFRPLWPSLTLSPSLAPQVGGLSHQLQRLHRSERSAWRRVAQLETSAGVCSPEDMDVDAATTAEQQMEPEPHVPHEELQLQATAPVPAAWRTTRLPTPVTKATQAQASTAAKRRSSPADSVLTRSPRRTPLRALQSQATPPPVYLGALPR